MSYPQAYPASHRPMPAYNPMAAISAPAGTFLPGTKVQVGSHRVVVEKYLSEGGFAHVYVVRLPHPIDGTESAVLKRVAVPDKAALANMRTEVETMKKLKGHRHIVKYIDSHASQLRGGGYEVFLLMEFCSGGGLIDFMNTRLQNRLTEPEIIKIFSDVAEGVACMHYLKPPLLHRDLKVENVLISRRGGVSFYKLCDFGSTAPPRPAATSAAEGRLIEDDVQRHTTLQYRSPEMIDVYRKQPIDEKSDIWALGVLLYKLCYYTTPFEEVGQMAILNASYKFPSYPQFSDRLKMLIASMLKENPQKRPNIYEVVREVCLMQGKDVPIKDIYSGRSQSEARRYQELPPSPTEQPRIGAVFSPPVQETPISIPEIAPMRRGRPTNPTSQHNSAKPSPSPYRGSTDPFAVLDRAGSKSRDPADEISNRFPTLDQFDILHEKGGKFEFEPTTANSKEEEDLSRKLTNALADDAFARPEEEPVRDSVVNRRSQVPSSMDTPSYQRKELPSTPTSRQQTPLYQPVPQKPTMVSTGTMTSPAPTPDFLEKKSSCPIFRFPSSDNQRQQPSASGRAKSPSPPRLPPNKPQPPPKTSTDRVNELTASSSRLSLDTARPSSLEVGDPLTRSKSANAKPRPVSMHTGKYDLPRESESARSSLELSRNPYEGVLSQARAEMDRDYDRANITSDVDYLRAKEEEELNRKREKRASGSSKHSKRSSLSHLSLSNTKTLFASRFGDAFRRFEGGQNDQKPQSPATEEIPKQSLTVTASEVTEPPDEGDNEEGDGDISPEMRRELERRRLSQEEKRVASAAEEYRRRVAEKGGGPRPRPDGRSATIQNKVQSLIGESNKSAPQKTATGYGRFTEPSNPPALQAKPSELRSEPLTTNSVPVYGSYTGGGPSPVVKETPIPKLSTASTEYAPAQRAQRTGPRPAAPPKPKALRVDSDLMQSGQDRSPTVAKTPTSPSEDWETSFSRRYPSLSGLEMVETEIEISKVTSLRTKEV
ncbi:putative serine/threonine protein kinase [Aspergillus chevalieri]|uniref:non-specific serine/threonine protein kinase n=1 Tax=Aspergillus chevalieri TaxID=182096 RepID=A0A7R7ZJK4_ASPCH|nr:uncharacterized protein ACHE_11046S [Aspergillus chevalieri]BCR83644.1 hypothetical protein ACHE_11046S [Aspergillus chevalieri]